jgi:hypothetical protein
MGMEVVDVEESVGRDSGAEETDAGISLCFSTRPYVAQGAFNVTVCGFLK